MRVQQLVDRTPATRNRAVDLLRVGALVMVVLGHWLKQGWYVNAAGDLHRAGLLGIATWTHPLTWVFQVMPVFFVVGGFANTRSWRSAHRHGTTYGGWLATRTERLTRPVVPLLLFWAAATVVVEVTGVEGRWLEVASVTALVPTWFLATYLVVVALAPWQVRAWDRWGPATLVVPAAAALAVDALSVTLDSTPVGAVNLLLVWGTLQQVGVAWADGWFRVRSRAVVLAVTGLVAALLLVALGPYGVSMVGVDGYGLNNTNPPRATVLALGFFLVGTAITGQRVLARVAHRPRVWAGTVLLESRMMTIYLWHPTALGLLAAVAMPLGGLGLTDRPSTAGWWAIRPLWFLALVVVTTGLVILLGRWESPVWTRTATGRGPGLPLLEVAVTAVGLAVLASEGMTRGPATLAVAVTTAAALWLIDRRLLRPVPTRRDLRGPAGTFGPDGTGEPLPTVDA